MRLSRREMFWLVLVPSALGVGTAVGTAFDLRGGTTSAVIWVVVAGVAGLILPPALQAYAPRGDGERPRWFAPGLGLVIAGGTVASALGPSVEACLLAFFSGVLLSFTGLVVWRVRALRAAA